MKPFLFVLVYKQQFALRKIRCNIFIYETALLYMPKKEIAQAPQLIGTDFIERLGKEGWTHIRNVVDIVREPVLVLDRHLQVMTANEPFYQKFWVEPKDTEEKVVYQLGDGQWNIPSLRKLLEDILPKNTFFKGFKVTHEFPLIGRRIMILNACQIHCKEDPRLEPCPPIILLAMEDVTEIILASEKLANHANQLEAELAERTLKQDAYIEKLEKEIHGLKRRPASLVHLN